jgi:ribosomal protein S18 acetylase RimI-like enzyme
MPTATDIRIRSARASDRAALVALLPQLADFDIPIQREPSHLWESDAELLEAVLTGEAPKSFVDVAETLDRVPQIIGFVLVSMRDEMLSHRPSAHLEAIVVRPDARGRGFGRQLMVHTEQEVRRRGAESLTLHVFSQNHRALSLYEARGFDSELIRAVKWL